ncbi:MAG: sporulation protein [Candidatus Eremiobacteraeota bacterium]|nr:sporulation protein [Candidatus Eremiobacteraeota bacterium]
MAEKGITENVASVITSTLKDMVKTDTVVGKHIQIGDVTVIPVIKVSMGFGIGGGGAKEQESKDMEGGGGGGVGMSVEPVAFLVVSGNEVHLMNVGKKTSIEAIFDSMPDLVSKTATALKDMHEEYKKDKEEKKE